VSPSDTSKYCRCNSSSCCCVDCNWLCSRASWGDIAWEGSTAIALLSRTSFYTLQKEKCATNCKDMNTFKVASSNTHKGILWRFPPMTLQETDGSSCSVSSTTGVIPSASFTSFDWVGGDTCSAWVSALLGSSGSFPADPGTSSEAFLSLDANRLGESFRTTLYNYNIYI
jgi:hypothetical protein